MILAPLFLLTILMSFPLPSTSFTSSVTIDCNFEYQQWQDFNRVYLCSVQNDLKVTAESTAVTKVMGSDPVNGLSIAYKTLHYFPQNLDQFFKNMTVLDIHSSELREIRQHDLAPFTRLRALFLSNNSIHFIEKDTFKDNLALEVIWLNLNDIKYIDPNVFDHLQSLRALNLNGTVYDFNYAKSPIQVHFMIAHVSEIFSFPSVLWHDNQELTTELHKLKISLIISGGLHVLLVLVVAGLFMAKKLRRSNRVHGDTSKTSFLFEMPSIRDRLQSVNFN